MKNIKLILLSIITFTIFIPIKPKEQGNLAIWLDLNYDDSEKIDSVSTRELQNLIKSQNAFILTNDFVWQYYKLANRTKKTGDVNFDFNNFDIYQKDNLILIVPHKYQKKLKSANLGLNLKKFQKIEANNKITNFNSFNTELNFGLKKQFNQILPYLLTLKSRKFIQDLKFLLNGNESADLEWNIYFSGHGSSYYQTCGITEDCFKELLAIFRNLNIHTFFYDSCFAAGKIVDYIFTTDGKAELYPFPIFCRGFEETQTYVKDFDYNEFFNKLREIKSDNLDTYNNFALYCLNLDAEFDVADYSRNIISIRYPNSSSFIIPNITNQLYVINENVNDEDLNDLNDTELIILNIPFFRKKIKIADQKIISGMKGNAWHYIESLDAPEIFLSDISDIFCLNQYHSLKKIFLINEALIQFDQDDDYNDQPFKNCKLEKITIFFNSDLKNYLSSFSSKYSNFEMFYIFEGNGYKIQLNSNNEQEIKCLSKNETEKYLKFYSETKVKIENGEQLKNFIPNKILRKLYPWIVTSGFMLYYYIKYKWEIHKKDIYKFGHEKIINLFKKIY